MPLRHEPYEIDGTTNDVTGLETDTDGIVQGLYTWTASSTEDDDGFNVIKPYLTVGAGRWLRLQRTELYYPQGKLAINGKTKWFTGTATISSNGEATINLTKENTTTGTAFFTRIDFISANAIRNTSSAVEVPAGCEKTLSSGNKVLTVKFVNGLNMLLLGNSQVNTPSGIEVRIMVMGE